MNLNNFSVKDLKFIANKKNVDLSSATNKAEIVNLLEAAGITADDIVMEKNVKESLLVKMERQNFRFDADINGTVFTFTKEHPYVVMTEDEAQQLFDSERGFRIATPREVQEYYG